MSTTPAADQWMESLWTQIKGKKLQEICIPGSHDTGMSVSQNHTSFAKASNTQTQTGDILSQLNNGIRYFDIRPVYFEKSGEYLTGHYGEVIGGGFGATGQSIDSVVAQLDSYCKSHKELIILNISHPYHIKYKHVDIDALDVHGTYADGLPAMSADHLKTCLEKFTGPLDPYLVTDPDINHPSFSLQQSTLETLREKPKNAEQSAIMIVCYNAPNEFPPNSAPAIMPAVFRHWGSINIYDDYADEDDDLNTMRMNQLTKMDGESDGWQNSGPGPGDKYFIFNWTLTEKGIDVFTRDLLQMAKAAREYLAKDLNPDTGQLLVNNCSSARYPNVLNMDGVEDDLQLKICLEIMKRTKVLPRE